MNYGIDTIRALHDTEVVELLKILEDQFRTSDSWKIELISIEKVIPLCRYVFTERLEYAEVSQCLYKSKEIPLFMPYIASYFDGREHIVVPPIVEKRNGCMYLCDGMHRLYSARNNGTKMIYAVTTNNCRLPLPGVPQRWDLVKENDYQISVEYNFENFNREGLTGYSKFCNGIDFWIN